MADVGQEEVGRIFDLIYPNTIHRMLHSFSRILLLQKKKLSKLEQKSFSWRYISLQAMASKPYLLRFEKDLKREFVTELIYPAVQANCIYEVRIWPTTSTIEPSVIMIRRMSTFSVRLSPDP